MYSIQNCTRRYMGKEISRFIEVLLMIMVTTQCMTKEISQIIINFKH